jgi:hypothetical protein
MTELDGRLAWSDVQPFTEYVEAARSARRFAMVLAAAFAVAGLVGAAIAAFSFRAQLYGVSAADPIAYGAAPLTVTMAVALAVWLPVRRATRVNPAEAPRIRHCRLAGTGHSSPVQEVARQSGKRNKTAKRSAKR